MHFNIHDFPGDLLEQTITEPKINASQLFIYARKTSKKFLRREIKKWKSNWVII